MAYEYLGESLLRGAESQMNKDEMLRSVQPQNAPGGHWDDPGTDELETRPGWGLGTAQEDSFMRTAPSATNPNAFNMNEWERRRVREQGDATLAKVAESTAKLDYWRGVAQDTQEAYGIGEALLQVATSRGKDQFTSSAGRAAGEILSSRPVKKGIASLTGASEDAVGGVMGGLGRAASGLSGGESIDRALVGGVGAGLGGKAGGAIGAAIGGPIGGFIGAGAGSALGGMASAILPGSKKPKGLTSTLGRTTLPSAADLLKGHA